MIYVFCSTTNKQNYETFKIFEAKQASILLSLDQIKMTDSVAYFDITHK